MPRRSGQTAPVRGGDAGGTASKPAGAEEPQALTEVTNAETTRALSDRATAPGMLDILAEMTDLSPLRAFGVFSPPLT